jgi:hypothetical protein
MEPVGLANLRMSTDDYARNLPEHCSEFPRALEVHRVEQDVNPGHPNPRLPSKRTTWSSVTEILLHY